ncbi:MAG: NADP-dependent oxidoreductase [Planctomycetota bacterium]|nr:NADP-dependent oxidoreductase [Planctomycetota bacterium]
MTATNRRITLAARPRGYPRDSDFRLVEEPVPELSEGEFLVHAVYLSVDPYMRGRMNAGKSYADPLEIGDVMVGESVGRVVASRRPGFAEGTYVAGMFGWQEYAVSSGKGVRVIDPAVAPISSALHVLGMPGLTAYFGLLEVCEAKAGDTVLVSGAAGAVGSTVGQLAKIHGCRAVGVAGSDEKVEFITEELGFDAGFNYKKTDNYRARLRELCPDGIDVYFDNVGGDITDAVFPVLSLGARVGVCGQISQYNLEERQVGPRLLWHLIVKRATVRGFLVFDFADRFPEALGRLTDWVRSGRIKYRERFTDGIESAPRAFLEMMRGANTGKQLVKVSEPA